MVVLLDAKGPEYVYSGLNHRRLRSFVDNNGQFTGINFFVDDYEIARSYGRAVLRVTKVEFESKLSIKYLGVVTELKDLPDSFEGFDGVSYQVRESDPLNYKIFNSNKLNQIEKLDIITD